MYLIRDLIQSRQENPCAVMKRRAWRDVSLIYNSLFISCNLKINSKVGKILNSQVFHLAIQFFMLAQYAFCECSYCSDFLIKSFGEVSKQCAIRVSSSFYYSTVCDTDTVIAGDFIHTVGRRLESLITLINVLYISLNRYLSIIL